MCDKGKLVQFAMIVVFPPKRNLSPHHQYIKLFIQTPCTCACTVQYLSTYLMIPTFSYSKLCKFNESHRRTQSVTGHSGAHLRLEYRLSSTVERGSRLIIASYIATYTYAIAHTYMHGDAVEFTDMNDC